MSLVHWTSLDNREIHSRFGTTTVHEKPAAFAAPDGLHWVVLRGELDDHGDENLWWSLCRTESGETVELARDYGVEEMDGDVVEVSWDGLFPAEWVDSYAAGFSDWIRISVTEILEKFGETVEFEQPQAWRHRSGEFYLVLLGDSDEETQEEEYAWSLVREQGGEYVEIAECHPGNGFGALELEGIVQAVASASPESAEPPPPESSDSVAEADQLLEDEDEEALFDGWWEAPPFDWGDRMVTALEKAG
jgi:hypothetical protein